MIEAGAFHVSGFIIIIAVNIFYTLTA